MNKRERSEDEDGDADRNAPKRLRSLRSYTHRTGKEPTTYDISTGGRRRRATTATHSGTRTVPASRSIDLAGSLRYAPVATWAPTRQSQPTSSRARPTSTSSTTSVQSTLSLLSSASIPSLAPSSSVVSLYSPRPSTSASYSVPTTSSARPRRYTIDDEPEFRGFPMSMCPVCPLCSEVIHPKDMIKANDCLRHYFHVSCLRNHQLNKGDHPLASYYCPSCWLEGYKEEIEGCKAAGIQNKYYLREPERGQAFLYSYANTMASLNEEDKECYICRMKLNDGDQVVPQCGHAIHERCLRKCHKNRKTGDCPACREEIKTLACDIEDEENFRVKNYYL